MDTILISYDNRDEIIAAMLKTFLENIFLNAEIYVAGRSLQGGNIWIEDIRKALKSSKAIITLVTRNSINNKWVYFESGAGFTEDKTVPLVLDNLEMTEIPAPLNLIQARLLSEEGLQMLIEDVAKKLNVRKPSISIDVQNLIKNINNYFQIQRVGQLQELINLKQFAPNIKKQWVYKNTCLVHDFIIDENEIAIDTHVFPNEYVIQLFGRTTESANYLFNVMCKKTDFLPEPLNNYERKNSRLIYKKIEANSDIKKAAENLTDLLCRIEKYSVDILL